MSEEQKPDPLSATRRLARAEAPKRFYENVTVTPSSGGFAVTLDGRVARTPARNRLVVPTEAMAALLAEEWSAQGERIEPVSMPLTRIVNVAIDHVAHKMDAVRADIVAYAGSDLVCYRADEPDELVEREAAAWSPLIEWAQSALNARFSVLTGVVHQPQPAGALAAVDRALRSFGAVELAAIHTIVTLTGSAIIALAVAQSRLSAEIAWEAAHADEDWQMSRWGADTAALERRDRRWRQAEAAALILRVSATR